METTRTATTTIVEGKKSLHKSKTGKIKMGIFSSLKRFDAIYPIPQTHQKESHFYFRHVS